MRKIPAWMTMADGGARCLRCGGCEAAPFPMPVDAFAPWCEYFGAKHAACKDTGRVDTPAASVEEWRGGWDTGISSVAIYSHMMGLPQDSQFGPGYPRDPDDFGRCYRLLKVAPEWRERIGEMATYGPDWAALAGAWDELTALYEVEAPSKRAPKLYDQMKALLDGGARPQEENR